jgi:signal transduction histidine kinase
MISMWRCGDREGIPARAWLTALLFIAFVGSFAVYVFGEKQIDRANERRYLSYRLADQLRQSSDDLTRMVRTYVVTGDPRFKRAFRDILDIRDGRRERPEGYDQIYWDLVQLEPGYASPPLGAGLSLLDAMRQAGFTEDEFALLAEAKDASDALTSREFAAMALVEAQGPDFEANRMRAIAMLHDGIYHQAKAGIMGPINAFYAKIEARTLADVHHAEWVARILRFAFMAFTAAAAFFLWRTYVESREILGGSVQRVHARITRIGKGDFGPDAADAEARPESVLHGLGQMAARLQSLETERGAATRALVAKNEELERSNADLEQFAYVASHDLQTPLRNIVSYTQLLERRYHGRFDADADEFLGFIVGSTKKMSLLIGDLLNYARVSSHAEPLETVAAAPALSQALDNLRQALEQAGAEVTVGALPSVRASAVHLVSLFQNLVGNAIKYRSPDRKLRIAIDAHREASGLWCFSVADNGIGIDPAYHHKVFEIFQRLNPAAEAEGTGIGLTLCRRIVHRFGGAIRLESKPGVGSTFFFTLRDGAELG